MGYEDVPITDAYHLGEPDDPGHQTHLFLDDFSIKDRWDAKRVQKEPVKHPRNPVGLRYRDGVFARLSAIRRRPPGEGDQNPWSERVRRR